MSVETENAVLPPHIAHSHGPSTSDQALSTEKSQEALFARLTELVKEAPVTLFMKGTPKSPVCRFSRRIVRVLNDHKIMYSYFNVLSDEDVRVGLKAFGEWPTFPQLWVEGELVGGLDIVKEEFSSNPSFLNQHSREENTA
ncbi:thioredoxin-like protein [Fusarium flagelliforme]|uniref:Putative thioredoxin n=1 Tax=Fusarium flagelliforme TaxID=2675880 RepID=A0A395MEA8_9HYPO|nr:thioredoxin-like protein [Fusarium flagelliforme]KAH7188067.1 thioredoxin-like protein [Fusarium flagelliforme]RFN46272.1 putative thioredoxin [Fusarium flagelliforme]